MDEYYQSIIKRQGAGNRLTQEERIFSLIYSKALQGLKTPLPLIMDLRIANHTARLTALHHKFPGVIQNHKWWVGTEFHSEYFINIPTGQLSILKC